MVVEMERHCDHKTFQEENTQVVAIDYEMGSVTVIFLCASEVIK